MRGVNQSQDELVESLGEDLLDKALKRLTQASEVSKPKRGNYELSVSSDPLTLREEDSEKTPDGGTKPDE